VSRIVNSPADNAAPVQSFGTQGIKPMARPGLVTRALMRVVAAVERLNLRFSKVGNPPFTTTLCFHGRRTSSASGAPFAPSSTRFSRARTTSPASTKSPPTAGYGLQSERNIARCPQTWRVCRHIPGLLTAMFSILEPGKHLPPHRGPYNGVLRLHLGLIVPEPREKLGIRVDRETYRWQEGEAVIFDDAYEHEAWNRTDQTRVVLFADFVKPLRFAASVLNWLVLHIAVFTPFVREGIENQKKWEKRFYAEAEALRNS
jgi:ornithine lipid ester-linked acyl 2-hydroxylase